MYTHLLNRSKLTVEVFCVVIYAQKQDLWAVRGQQFAADLAAWQAARDRTEEREGGEPLKKRRRVGGVLKPTLQNRTAAPKPDLLTKFVLLYSHKMSLQALFMKSYMRFFIRLMYISDETTAGTKDGDHVVSMLMNGIDHYLPLWAEKIRINMDNAAMNKSRYICYYGLFAFLSILHVSSLTTNFITFLLVP